MEINIKMILILILCMNNGIVKGNIIEELLIAVNRLQSNMDVVIHKVENIENNFKAELKGIKENIKVLHEEVETNSNQDKIIIESLGSLKEEVKSFQMDYVKNAEDIRLRLEQGLQQDADVCLQNFTTLEEEMKEENRENIERINLSMEGCVEKCLDHGSVIIENFGSLKEEVKSAQRSLKEKVNSLQKDNVKNAAEMYHKIESDLEEMKVEISVQNLHLFGPQKLYTDNKFSYYKVPVTIGTKLENGAVQKTCEKVGMNAVCRGSSGCGYDNYESCVVTTLSSDCGNPMLPLSKILCDGKNPRQCSHFEGVFSLRNHVNGGCGCVDGSWCVDGKNFTSGEMREGKKRIYYGYCAKRK